MNVRLGGWAQQSYAAAHPSSVVSSDVIGWSREKCQEELGVESSPRDNDELESIASAHVDGDDGMTLRLYRKAGRRTGCEAMRRAGDKR